MQYIEFRYLQRDRNQIDRVKRRSIRSDLISGWGEGRVLARQGNIEFETDATIIHLVADDAGKGKAFAVLETYEEVVALLLGRGAVRSLEVIQNELAKAFDIALEGMGQPDQMDFQVSRAPEPRR